MRSRFCEGVRSWETKGFASMVSFNFYTTPKCLWDVNLASITERTGVMERQAASAHAISFKSPPLRLLVVNALRNKLTRAATDGAPEGQIYCNPPRRVPVSGPFPFQRTNQWLTNRDAVCPTSSPLSAFFPSPLFERDTNHPQIKHTRDTRIDICWDVCRADR